MAVTYKTVIQNAITGFNDIQSKLHKKFKDINSLNRDLKSTSSIDSDYGYMTPTEMANTINKINVYQNQTKSATVTPTIDKENGIYTASFTYNLEEGYHSGTVINGTYTFANIDSLANYKFATDSQMRDLALRHVDSILDVNSFAASDEVQAIAAR